MIITQITQDLLESKPIYYSRWHSCSTPEKGRHYDINIGGQVGTILNVSKDTFIICTFLTELVELDDDYTNTNGFKIWDLTLGTMILENDDGVRYFGTIESLYDKGEEGLYVQGTSCLFTDNLDEAYIESFFKIRNLIPKKNEIEATNRDYQSAIDYVKSFEPIIKEMVPEKFI